MGEGPLTLLLFRPPFALLHSSFVLALRFHRLDHLQHIAMVPQVAYVLRWNFVVSEPLLREV